MRSHSDAARRSCQDLTAASATLKSSIDRHGRGDGQAFELDRRLLYLSHLKEVRARQGDLDWLVGASTSHVDDGNEGFGAGALALWRNGGSDSGSSGCGLVLLNHVTGGKLTCEERWVKEMSAYMLSITSSHNRDAHFPIS